MEGAPPSRLLRVLGVAFGIAVVVGGTVGQGILRAPGQVALGVPAALPMLALWVGVGALCAVDAMSTVELAASIRRTGGPYIFVRRAFGPLAGLAVGLTDWLGNVGGIAFISVVFGEYLHRLGILTAVSLAAIAAATPLIIGAVQLLGTRAAGQSQELGSALKGLLFLLLVAALLLAPRGAPAIGATLPAPVTLLGVIAALRAVSGTYSGWNAAAYFCEEVADPARDIVRATFIGLGLVTGLYLLVNIAYLAVLSPAEMAGDTLVAAKAAGRVFGPRADIVVTAVSLVSLVTGLNAYIMQMPRVLFAIARDNGVPELSAVAANGTPRAALVATVGLGAALATVGIYDTLLALATSLLAAMSVVVNAAAIAMRRREPGLERPYRMPLFPLPALFSLTVNAALLAAFMLGDVRSAGAGFALMLTLTALTYAATRRRGRPAA